MSKAGALFGRQLTDAFAKRFIGGWGRLQAVGEGSVFGGGERLETAVMLGMEYGKTRESEMSAWSLVE